jgi:stage II sporulation protein D
VIRAGRLAAAAVSIGALAAAVHASGPEAAPGAMAPEVVVHLSEHQAVETAEVTIRSPYRVFRLEDGQPIAFGRSLVRGRIEPIPEGVRIGGVPLATRGVELVPDEPGAVNVGSRPYRGALQILRGDGASLSIRNRLAVDDYLLGVVGAEMPADFPAEALRAQAIVARTYALHGPESLPGQARAALTDDVLSQVYRGIGGEDPRIDRAVRETRGLALVGAGKPITGYFHSTCGGSTADVFFVFGRPPSSALRGVPCGYCNDAPYARWSAEIPRSELERAAAALGAVGRLATVEVAKTDAAGRATRLAITVAAGSGQLVTKEVPAADFRLRVGPSKLRSSFLTRVSPLPDGALRFEGRGFGHGVGLCQMGARAMAARGFSAEAILLHYFPGAEIRKLYG